MCYVTSDLRVFVSNGGFKPSRELTFTCSFHISKWDSRKIWEIVERIEISG